MFKQLTRSIAFVSTLGSALLLSGCQGVEPTLGAAVRNIEIKATAVAGKSLTVAAPADGKVARVDVREGANVGEGQLILTLSNPAVDRDHEIARAQVRLAEMNLRNVGLQRVVNRTSQPRGVADALQLVLSNKRAKLQRYRELRQRKDVSEQELEDAENEYAWAERDYLSQFATHGSIAFPAAQRQILEAELMKARADERLARERRAALQIASPLAGTVTAVRAIPGQHVYTRDPLVDVTDVSTVEIRGDVSPDLLRYVRPGTPVQVKVFSVPPQTFSSTVDHVMTMASTGDAATVVVRLPNEGASIRPNTTARITVQF
jgi:membrane fusion protein (multidrug efflux system)